MTHWEQVVGYNDDCGGIGVGKGTRDEDKTGPDVQVIVLLAKVP